MIEADPEYARHLIRSRHPEIQAVLRGLEKTSFLIVNKRPFKGLYMIEFEVPFEFFAKLPFNIRGIGHAPVMKHLLDTIPELAALDFTFGLIDAQKRLFGLNLAFHVDMHNWALTLWYMDGDHETRWIMGKTWVEAMRIGKQAGQDTGGSPYFSYPTTKTRVARWTVTREDLLDFM